MTTVYDIKAKPTKQEFGTVFIADIRNPFDAINSAVRRVDIHGRKLCSYVPPYSDCVIHMNGKEVTDLDTIVPMGATITIAPVIAGGGGGGGKMVLRIVAMVAIAIFSAGAGLAALNAIGSMTALTQVGAYAILYGTQMLVMAVGAMIVNAVLPPQTPDAPQMNSPEAESPTYNWTGLKTSRSIDAAIPVLYGKAAVGGNVINEYITYSGRIEYLNTLLALCQGEIDTPQLSDVTINKRPFGEFQGVSGNATANINFRVGTYDQAIIDGFDDSVFNNVLNAKLIQNQWISATTQSTGIDKLKVHLSCPNGIYSIDSRTGNVLNFNGSTGVAYQMRYRKVGDPTWIDVTEVEYTYNYNYKYYEMYGPLDSEGNEPMYRRWSTRTVGSYRGSTFNESYGGYYYRFSYVSKTQTGQFDSTTLNFTGGTRNPLKRVIDLGVLPLGQYEVQVKRLTAEESAESTTSNSDMFLSILEEINTTDLNYGGVALAGINLKATDQLQGQSPNYKFILNRKDLTLQKSTGSFTASSSNPAWVCYDILTNNQYGYGKSYLDVDYDTFEEWATFCDTIHVDHKLEFNGVIDTVTNIWEALQTVATVGRGQVVLRGTKYSVVYDAPATMTQMFSDANIDMDTFKVSYIGVNDIASEVTINYTNKLLDYEMDTVSVIDNTLYSSQLQPKKTSLTVKGITSNIEALAMGRYMLANNKYIKRTVEFSAGIDAIASTVGDVIGISSSVVQWGTGGHITEIINATDIRLDKPITFVTGITYVLRVKKGADDSIVSFNFTVPSDTETDVVTISDTTGLSIEDTYSIHEQTSDILKFRISEISRDGDLTRKIKAVEYNESILDFDYDNDVVSQTQPLPTASLTLNSIDIQETLRLKSDGSITTELEIDWDVDFSTGETFTVQYRHQDSEIWLPIVSGIQQTSTKFYATDLIEGETYIFRVLVNDFTYLDYTYNFLGKLANPSDPTNIQATSSNGKMIITWDAIPDLDLKHYEVLLRGVTYITAQPSIIIENLERGTYNFKVRSVDTTGNFSNYVDGSGTVTTPSWTELLSDNYLIEQAFKDGKMTIYFNPLNDPPASPQDYDLWKISLNELSLEDLQYESFALKDFTWDDFNATSYKYFKSGAWYLCTREQIYTIDKTLGYVTATAVADNNVRVFTVKPYPPYSVGDLWVDGNTVKICTTEKLE